MARRVMVVEDHADIRMMMKILLETYGFEVVEASDGYEAVEKALAKTPDVILMDLAMPVLDGINSTRAMRQHEELADVPILAVTAYGDFYRERALEAGCNDVLQKPLDFETLRAHVSSYVN